MTKQQLMALSKEDLLKVLNEKHKEKPQEILEQFEIEEFEGICVDCLGQTHQASVGDEGWTVCDNCQTQEGSTCEIDVIPALKVCFNYRADAWQEASDDIGQEM